MGERQLPPPQDHMEKGPGNSNAVRFFWGQTLAEGNRLRMARADETDSKVDFLPCLGALGKLFPKGSELNAAWCGGDLSISLCEYHL